MKPNRVNMSDIKNEEWSIDTQIYYPQIGETQVSPNGEKIIYTVREALLGEEKSEFIYHLYLVDVNTKEKRQITFGEGSETKPKWSPCGNYIAFISTRKKKANLYSMRFNGGEAWALTDDEKYGITEIEWSPTA